MKVFMVHISLMALLMSSTQGLGNNLNQTQFKNHQRISETAKYEQTAKYAKYFQPQSDKPKEEHKEEHKIVQAQLLERGEPDLTSKIKTNEDSLRTQKIKREKQEQYILMCLLALFTGVLFVVIIALIVYCFKRTKVSAQQQQYRESVGRDNQVKFQQQNSRSHSRQRQNKEEIMFIGKNEVPNGNFGAKKQGSVAEVKVLSSKASKKPTRVWEMSNLRETVKDPALLQTAERSDDPNLNFYKKDQMSQQSISTNQSVPQFDFNRPAQNDQPQTKEQKYAREFTEENFKLSRPERQNDSTNIFNTSNQPSSQMAQPRQTATFSVKKEIQGIKVMDQRKEKPKKIETNPHEQKFQMQQFLGQSPGKNSESADSPKSLGKKSRQSDKIRIQSPQSRMSDAGGGDGLDGIVDNNLGESFKNSQKEYKEGEALNLEAINLEGLDGDQEGGQEQAHSPSKFDIESLDPKLKKKRDMLVKEAIRESGLYTGPEPSKRY